MAVPSDSGAATALTISEASSDTSVSSGESCSISSSSNTKYYSFENIQQQPYSATAQNISSSDYGSGIEAAPLSPEQLLSLDRQKHDPPSYYQEPSLNKGPVDKVPRLCNVSSQYAINDLAIYSAMDDPDQMYKLKSVAQTVAHFEYERLQQLPAETAHGIDHSQIIYDDDGACYFRDY